MKQVTQKLRSGLVEVKDVPTPTLSDGFVLVRNTASVISAGTEKSKIDMGKKNLLQKAKNPTAQQGAQKSQKPSANFPTNTPHMVAHQKFNPRYIDLLQVPKNCN